MVLGRDGSSCLDQPARPPESPRALAGRDRSLGCRSARLLGRAFALFGVDDIAGLGLHYLVQAQGLELTYEILAKGERRPRLLVRFVGLR